MAADDIEEREGDHEDGAPPATLCDALKACDNSEGEPGNSEGLLAESNGEEAEALAEKP